MPEHQRDMLEVAALLHDLGKLGIPDRVLQKSSQLVGDEQALMELHVQVGLELLRGAGASEEMLASSAAIAVGIACRAQPTTIRRTCPSRPR